jgi:hypothetical protein
MTNKKIRARTNFNFKRESIDLQVTNDQSQGRSFYKTIASSSPDPNTPEILKLPDFDIERGITSVEEILAMVDGYVEFDSRG